MVGQSYKKGKKGAGRHVQLPEYLMATVAWKTMKPGPRALYVELKRRFYGRNNGRIVLSYREAADLLCVHRNTIGLWFQELQDRGFIAMTRGAHLGPSGIGQSAHWSLLELEPSASRPANNFRDWRPNAKPRHKKCEGASQKAGIRQY